MSQLPVWIVKRIGSGRLGLECPYRDCGGKVVVNARKWLRSREPVGTRSCTYCFRVSWISAARKEQG